MPPYALPPARTRAFRLRLLLVALAIVALMAAALLYGSGRLLETHLQREADSRSQQFSALLAAAVTPLLARGDHAAIVALAATACGPQGLSDLTVVDANARRVAQCGQTGATTTDGALSRRDIALPLTQAGKNIGELHLGVDQRSLIAWRDAFMHENAVLAVIALAIAAVLMLACGYLLTRHLSTLLRVARRVAAGHPAPALVVGSDEIGQLAAAFRQMQQSAAAHDAELAAAQETHVALLSQAHAGAQAKNAFLATISHEIRTPINGILGMTQLTLGTQLTEEQREYLDWVKRSAGELLGVLNDMLEYAAIEAGRIELESTPFSPQDILEGLVLAFSSSAGDKGLQLQWHGLNDDSLPAMLSGDPQRLRQILDQLVANAIKFTESGSVRIAAKAFPAADTQRINLRFSICDTGVGISGEQLEMIFSPFAQGEHHTRRKSRGTGLGLAIARRLCALMSGRLWAESVPDQGSTFHCEIPFDIVPEIDAELDGEAQAA